MRERERVAVVVFPSWLPNEEKDEDRGGILESGVTHIPPCGSGTVIYGTRTSHINMCAWTLRGR